jgi:hypothetical protein
MESMSLIAVPNKVLQFTGKKLPPAAGKGRAKGTPNRVTRLLRDAILLAAVQADAQMKKAAGDPSAASLDGYLTWIALNHPVQFAALLGKVLPLQVAASGIDDRCGVMSSESRFELGKTLAFALRLGAGQCQRFRQRNLGRKTKL